MKDFLVDEKVGKRSNRIALKEKPEPYLKVADHRYQEQHSNHIAMKTLRMHGKTPQHCTWHRQTPIAFSSANVNI